MVRKCCSFIPLGHTGWRKKHDGAWSIPKGEIDASEDPKQAARREFAEELVRRPASAVASLGRDPPAWGKRVIEADFDTASLVSNSFEIERGKAAESQPFRRSIAPRGST